MNESLEIMDPKGEFGKIPEEELIAALRLRDPFLSRGDVEEIVKALRVTPWPNAM